MYFYTCPYCGSNLDPGERCDCIDNDKMQQIEYEQNTEEEQNGQIIFVFEKTA